MIQAATVQFFMRRLLREGMLGDDLLKLLEVSSRETRAACVQLAGASGFKYLAANLNRW